MYECPECGGRSVEVGGFIVCSSCGLVLDQLVEGRDSGIDGNDASEHVMLLNDKAQLLTFQLSDGMKVYGLARFAGVDRKAALAIALYVGLRRDGNHVPLRRICEQLAACGVKVSYKRAVKGLLRVSRYLHRPTPFFALRIFARRLSLDEMIVRRAEKVLSKVKYLGGRDPYLIALAALYVAAEGKLTYYRLAKETGRSPSRIRDNVLYLLRHL